MTHPHRITCSTAPDASVLENLATRQQHVVLQFPVPDDAGRQAFDATGMVNALQQSLPEYFSVFDAGLSPEFQFVTVMRVISHPEVLAIEDSIHAAAVEFRTIATRLIEQLSAQLELPADEIARYPLIRMSLRARGMGQLVDDWQFMFHGLECGFRNTRTKQVVEVQLDYAGEYGALDPFFFHLFLASTPHYSTLAVALTHGYHDTCRAMEILEQRGRLRPVVSVFSQHESLVAQE